MPARATATGQTSRKKVGRPRVLDRDAIMAQACEKIAGGMLVKEVAKSLGVTDRSIRAWGSEPEFVPLYARAREDQAHSIAEEILPIADAATPEDVQVARLRAENRKWLAAKIAPRHYGDKIEIEAKVAQVIFVAEVPMHQLDEASWEQLPKP